MPEIARLAKQYVQRIARSFGFTVERIDRDRSPPPVFSHPIDAFYHRLFGRTSAAIQCDLNDCIAFNGLGYGRENWHPFASFLLQYQSDHRSNYRESVLERYYQLWQPSNAAEAIARGQNLENSLVEENRFSYVEPWRSRSAEEAYAARKAQIEQFGTALGYPDMTIEDGMLMQGPVSRRRGEIEVERLVGIYESISEKGYVREGGSEGDISCIVLERGGDYRYVIMGGHHRAAALTALGYESVPVRPVNSLIIEERHVDHWPHVQDGDWTRESALQYMRFLFSNDWPEWARRNDLPTY